jgi:hypothetical protein
MSHPLILPKGIVPLMKNVPTMENAGKFVTHTKQPARYAISPTLDKHNTNLKIVWASILMMSRSLLPKEQSRTLLKATSHIGKKELKPTSDELRKMMKVKID